MRASNLYFNFMQQKQISAFINQIHVNNKQRHFPFNVPAQCAWEAGFDSRPSQIKDFKLVVEAPLSNA